MPSAQRKVMIISMKTLKNNLYMLSFLGKLSPFMIICEIGIAIFQSITDFVVGIYIYNMLLLYINQRYNLTKFIQFATIGLVASIVRVILTKWYFSYKRRVLSVTLQTKISRIIRNKQRNVRYSSFENFNFYNTLKRANDKIYQLPNSVLSNVTGFLGFLITSILTSAFVATIDPVLLLFLFFPILYSIVNSMSNRFLYEKNKESVLPLRKQEYVQDTIFSKDAAQDLKTGKLYSALEQMWGNSNTELISIIKKYGIREILLSLAGTFLGSYLPLIVANLYAIYKYFVLGNISIVMFAAIITAINTFCNRLNRILTFLNKARSDSLYIDDWKVFMEFPDERITKGITCPSFDEIAFENVSFSYENGDKNALNNVNLKIYKGETVAIVGKNGSGKSTLIKLLLNLYEPGSGEIKFNSKNINDYELKSYRNKFGVIFQDYKIYGTSVAENVMMDIVKEEDEACIISALKGVGLYEKTLTLNYGINSTLTKEFDESGEVLSGGQNQKLAISRLYAKQYDIAILDEPSASLDPISEKRMFENLVRATKDKTVLFISHNLSSVIHADRIIFLENGTVVEEGTHKQLLKLGGKYAMMYKLQSQKYVSED